jgi:hypothetical protein
METRSYTVFKYDELTDDQKEKAIQNLYDLNINFDWWDSTYDDANNIGLKIEGFNLDRNRHCKGKFLFSAKTCADRVIADHGEQCETYKTAEAFLKEYNFVVETDDENIDIVPQLEQLENEFLEDLLEDYSIILQHEYEYWTSREAIEETIRANGYLFTGDGKID